MAIRANASQGGERRAKRIQMQGLKPYAAQSCRDDVSELMQRGGQKRGKTGYGTGDQQQKKDQDCKKTDFDFQGKTSFGIGIEIGY